MIRIEEIIKNNENPPSDVRLNIAEKLMPAINEFRKIWSKPMIITSGYRSKEHQIGVYRQKGITDISKIPMGSAHIQGLAVDIRDNQGVDNRQLTKYCLANLNILEQCGLWMEDPAATKSWVHLQCIPPISGNRIFKP